MVILTSVTTVNVIKKEKDKMLKNKIKINILKIVKIKYILHK